MKVIITGTTGMVGKGVMLECLDHPKVTKVLSISRRPPDVEHEKLEILIHNDFSDFSAYREKFSEYQACYLCMGVSAAGMSEEQYKTLTYDYTLALARELPVSGMTVTYVSGQGTDSSEKGRIMWARVKGRTENKLLSMSFKQAYMFRPGAIIPLRGIKSSTRLYQFFYDYFMWLIKLMKAISPNSIVSTTQLGLAMINVSLYGYNKNVLGPKDIIKASQNLKE